MSTVRDLITSALRLIGAVDAYSSLTENEAADGLEALNGLIESLSIEKLLIYSVIKEEFTLTGATTYTMGPAGTWNTVRPVKIEAATYKVGDQEYDFHIMNDQESQALDLRTLGGFPAYLHSDGAFPLATITVWPVPPTGDKVVLWSWKPLTGYTAVTDVISLPPGYWRMLKAGLAIEQAPEYSRPVPDAVAAMFRDAKAAIKRVNIQPIYLSCDPALLGRGSYPSQSAFLGGE